jgi:hypothetical protein
MSGVFSRCYISVSQPANEEREHERCAVLYFPSSFFAILNITSVLFSLIFLSKVSHFLLPAFSVSHFLVLSTALFLSPFCPQLLLLLLKSSFARFTSLPSIMIFYIFTDGMYRNLPYEKDMKTATEIDYKLVRNTKGSSTIFTSCVYL